MNKSNYNPFLKKLIIKNIFLLLLYIIVIFILLYLLLNFSDRLEDRLFYIIFVIIIFFALKYKIIDIKKIFAGLKAEIYVNKLLEKNGVIYSKNIIINNREIDQVIYYPKLVVLETKYGKGRISKKINKNITINNKSINKNNIDQVIRNCKTINIITKKSGYNYIFEPVLCFSNSFGDIVNGEVTIVSGDSIIGYLYENKNIDIKSAIMLKNFIENI
jgi:hypothetical protein